MPRTPTGRPPGRPKTKDYDTLLARVPSDLVHQVKRYAALHRQSISELIRDGLQWRIEHDTGESQHAAETLESARTVSAPQDVVPHDIAASPRYYWGKPCPKPGHTDAGTGKTERRKNNGRCRECDKEAKRQRRRTAAAQEG